MKLIFAGIAFIMLLLLLVLLSFGPVLASPEAAAAALPNEEAECRYLLSLCRSANSPALARQVASVAKVIRAKHEKAPSCLAECRNDFGAILDMSSPVWK